MKDITRRDLLAALPPCMTATITSFPTQLFATSPTQIQVTL